MSDEIKGKRKLYDKANERYQQSWRADLKLREAVEARLSELKEAAKLQKASGGYNDDTLRLTATRYAEACETLEAGEARTADALREREALYRDLVALESV